MQEKVHLTDHALTRLRQRAEIGDYREAKAAAAEALANGMSPERDPVLREILDLKIRQWPSSTFRVLDGVVFVFRGPLLVTVYPIAWANSFCEDAA